MHPEIIPSSRLARWALLLVCLAAFHLRFQGVNWPAFHPDEAPIGEAVNKAARGASMKGPPYAHGFFVLVQPAIWIGRGLDYVRNYSAFQRGLKDRVGGAENNILVARWFNVWAGTLISLIGYLLVRRITRSAWAGVLGAALLGLAQYPVEHSHYGETDIAMLLTLTTALWLMAVAADTRSKWSLVLAALAGGFAAGTKFQLVLLLPVMLALALAGRAPMRALKMALRSISVRFGLALVCFLLGFLLAMPEALDLPWFINGLIAEKARVYREGASSLAPFGGGIRVRYLLHFRELGSYLQTIGWPWLVLVAAGLPCLALRDFRRYLPITLLFPGLYLVFFIYLSPWVRSQEFMAFLPCFAVLAALPLICLWRSQRVALRLTALTLGLAAVAANGINGSRSASLFGWTDTRVLAEQWLEAHLPMQSAVATENYAEGAWPESDRAPICISKIEREGLAGLTQQGADYLLRAASISGRGLRNPLTDALFPAPQGLFDEFSRNSERLCVWAPLPPQGLATFVSPAIELYGVRKPVTPQHQIDLELPQPLFVNNYYDAEKGRQTFFPIGHKLGAATGLLIDRRKRVIAVGGPERPGAPIYLVLNTAERSATVVVRGFGQTRRVALEPYDAAIVPLKRSVWRPRLKQFEEITLSTEQVRDVLYIPCFARVAFSPAEAARICLDLGLEEAIWETFSEAELAAACDPATAYLLAVRSARWDWAEQLEPAVERLEEELDAAWRVSAATVGINGNSGYYFNEFARIRVNTTHDIIDQREADTGRLRSREIQTLDVLDLTEPVSNPSGPFPPYRAVLTLPVRLARGIYFISSEAMFRAESSADPSPATDFEIRCGVHYTTFCGPMVPGVWTNCLLEFPVARESQPRFSVRARSPGRLYFRNTEIRWTMQSMLEALHTELLMAGVTHAIARGKPNDAQRRLVELDTLRWGLLWNGLELMQLDLAVARALGDSEAMWRAAVNLQGGLAHSDYLSLQIMAQKEPRWWQGEVKRLAANLKTPIEFGTHLSLVSLSFDDNSRRVKCVWEAHKNETPPFAASFWIRRRGEWRKKQVCPLSDRQWLAKGERVAVDVALNEKFDGYTPDSMALGLETAVAWHPGAVPAAGSREGVVPFSALLDQ
ncbi:MAG: glycosyltransferase family 39 protein [Lentisphaerae bacterium]|nr:glycosyltransferase family 39 protein [Lentisphaerota bacterium]